jgi:hypothetical protein
MMNVILVLFKIIKDGWNEEFLTKETTIYYEIVIHNDISINFLRKYYFVIIEIMCCSIDRFFTDTIVN